jgi:hypothetical protein
MNSMIHPHTGQPILPLWIRPDGRACWPIMGASPDDPPKDEPKNDPPKDDPPKDEPKNDPPKDEPKNDPPKDDDPKALGYNFPADTRRADMTREQQIHYDAFQSRKHESRVKAYRQAVGDKDPEQVKAELDRLYALEREKMTEDERKVADARAEGRTEAAREIGLETAEDLLRTLLGDMPTSEKDELVDTIDLTKVLKDSGAADTDKVRKLAERIAPRQGRGNGRLDFGGGRERGSHEPTSGVQAGAERYRAQKGQKAGTSAT